MSSPRDASSTRTHDEVFIRVHEEDALVRKCSFLTSVLTVLWYMASFSTFPTTFSATPPPQPTTSTPQPTAATPQPTAATTRNHRSMRLNLRRRRANRLTLKVEMQPQPQPQFDHTTPLLVVFLATTILWSTVLKVFVVLLAYHLFQKLFFPNSRGPTLVATVVSGISEMSNSPRTVVKAIVLLSLAFVAKMVIFG